MNLIDPARRVALEALAAIQATATRAGAVGRPRQLATAMIGFAAMIIIPAVAMYWVRKRFRP
jgi:hypothetical protein